MVDEAPAAENSRGGRLSRPITRAILEAGGDRRGLCGPGPWTRNLQGVADTVARRLDQIAAGIRNAAWAGRSPKDHRHPPARGSCAASKEVRTLDGPMLALGRGAQERGRSRQGLQCGL